MTGRKSPSSHGERETGSFQDVVDESEVFSPPKASGEPLAEYVGRIQKSEDQDKFLLLMPSSNEWGELALEMNIDEVQEFKLVFEDSAGRKTYKVWVPSDSALKLVFRASDLPSSILMEKDSIRKHEPIAPWRYDLGRQYAPYQYTQQAPGRQAQYDHPTQYGQYTPSQYMQHETSQYTQYAPSRYTTQYGPTQYGQYTPSQYMQHETSQYTPYYPNQYVQYDPAQYGQYTPSQYGQQMPLGSSGSFVPTTP